MMQLQLQNGGVGLGSSYLHHPTLSPPPSLLHLSSLNLRCRSCRCFIPRFIRRKSRHFSHSLSSSPPIPWIPPAINVIALVAAAVVLSTPPPPEETLSNIPQLLSGELCDSSSKECLQDGGKKRIQRPKSRNAESCTSKCLTTCIRGGDGSPGEGPLNVRGPIVVFKQGFRTRNYCLVECSDICNLLDKAEKGR